MTVELRIRAARGAQLSAHERALLLRITNPSPADDYVMASAIADILSCVHKNGGDVDLIRRLGWAWFTAARNNQPNVESANALPAGHT
jgi:hypothetical protein